jgi:hypothetical protein
MQAAARVPGRNSAFYHDFCVDFHERGQVWKGSDSVNLENPPTFEAYNLLNFLSVHCEACQVK